MNSRIFFWLAALTAAHKDIKQELITEYDSEDWEVNVEEVFKPQGTSEIEIFNKSEFI